MGISRFTRDLAPYAEHFQLLQSGENSDKSRPPERWVIDGPSLVYHAYNNALARKISMSTVTANVLPTYQEVNEEVKACLATLEKHNIHIEALFFDGSLPDSKRDVRFDRLERTRKQLWDFRHGASGRRAFLPPSPFIVAGAIESLQTSDWTDKVSVVPEEADVACARAAATAPVSILTNDSDLALFPTHPQTRIIWLHSLVQEVQKDGSMVVQASFVTPSVLSSRLNLPSLLPLAFERHLDLSVSTATLVKRAKARLQKDHVDVKYAEFCAQYSATDYTAPSIDLSGLDPRIAEYVSQARSSPEAPHVYYPVLHEDPSRDASWSYGESIRQLAYTIFGRACSVAGGQVKEYYRKGPRIAGLNVPLLSGAGTTAVVAPLLRVLSPLPVVSSEGKTSPKPILFWWCLALLILAESKCVHGKLLDLTIVWALFDVGRQPIRPESWECMHLHANLQAVLYSLRMLKQILGYVESVGEPSSGAETNLLTLTAILNGMPCIEDLFVDVRTLRSLAMEVGTEEVAAMLQPMEKLLVARGAASHQTDGVEPANKAKKRKRKRFGGRGSQNAFELLAEQDKD